jgi:hypothetical protein
MDQETFVNHISRLSRHYFDIACKMVLTDVFNFNVINVDGKNDGGTDFASFLRDGKRSSAAYQITTQKSEIKRKIWNDAKKSIAELRINRFFFFCSLTIPEIDLRKIENEISQALNVQASCYDARTIAGFLLDANLAKAFLAKTNDLTYINNIKIHPTYQEVALYSYTLISNDSRKFKANIYDDTILFILYHKKLLTIKDIRLEMGKLLDLDIDSVAKNRIDSLMARGKIIVNDNMYQLDEVTKQDIEIRTLLYERELSNLISAQADILHDFHIIWTDSDCKNISFSIVSVYIQKQFENLKQAKTTMGFHPIFSNFSCNSMYDITNYLINNKEMERGNAEKASELFIENASTHPLIAKLTRSAMFLALQSNNPSYSATILGANRWSECGIIIEPTIAIPYICSFLYQELNNTKAKIAISAIKRAIKLDCKLCIPFFYLSECAGHLLEAKNYVGLELDGKEMQYSTNAYVSYYFSMKNNNNNIKIPGDLIDYLSTFSSSIRTERSDKKQWIRSIMTDLQSILNRSGVDFVSTPPYTHDDCKTIEEDYSYFLLNANINKRQNLINHDIYALKYTNDCILKNNEHWIILTYDNTLIKFGSQDFYKGWILNPFSFIDLTQTANKLSETNFISLLHTFATFSEQTLSFGARIMDRIISFCSKEMQNWEFKLAVEQFKKQMMNEYADSDYDISIIDTKTDEFLKKHNIKINQDTVEN